MKERTSVPKPDEEVVEVVREAEKMRDLLRAVLLHGPLQEMEPAEATKKQWQEGKKIATRDDEIVAELKRSREESSGLKEKKAKSEDKEGSGSKKKAKRSSEMEGSGSKEAKMFYSEEANMQLTRLDALEILEQPPVKPKVEENSESAVGNRKTKMVTRRMDKDIDGLPPLRRPLFYDKYHTNIRIVDTYNAHVAAETLFIQCLQCHYRIKGYAEYQEEVTDDEGEDHKLV
ncbi:hypothetical protein HU200_019367 [Digitaria exilis]|uniref:Uncharacterized protein n=1 Tax=Digitaria exilis TaxID=1010633 RepID=A0A835F381_9POAL|nr:hypothetical protein HU200_019367 [Digitaria exilis]